MNRLLALTFFALLFLFCSKLEGPGISLDTYADFRSQCLIIAAAYPETSVVRKELLSKTMNDFKLDSVRLERFFAYYKANPKEWPAVEDAVQKKLETLQKRRKNNG